MTLRCHGPDDLVFGRAADPSAGIAFVNADIRLGRTVHQKRQLALAFIDEVHRAFGVGPWIPHGRSRNPSGTEGHRCHTRRRH